MNILCPNGDIAVWLCPPFSDPRPRPSPISLLHLGMRRSLLIAEYFWLFWCRDLSRPLVQSLSARQIGGGDTTTDTITSEALQLSTDTRAPNEPSRSETAKFPQCRRRRILTDGQFQQWEGLLRTLCSATSRGIVDSSNKYTICKWWRWQRMSTSIKNIKNIYDKCVVPSRNLTKAATLQPSGHQVHSSIKTKYIVSVLRFYCL